MYVVNHLLIISINPKKDGGTKLVTNRLKPGIIEQLKLINCVTT